MDADSWDSDDQVQIFELPGPIARLAHEGKRSFAVLKDGRVIDVTDIFSDEATRQ